MLGYEHLRYIHRIYGEEMCEYALVIGDYSQSSFVELLVLCDISFELLCLLAAAALRKLL